MTYIREEWLPGLKAGDQVAVCVSMWTPRIKTVSRVTATQIIIDGEGRFRKENGREIGASYNPTRLQFASAEILEQIERNNLEGKFNQIKARSLSLDQLRQVLAILEPKSEGDGNGNTNNE